MKKVARRVKTNIEKKEKIENCQTKLQMFLRSNNPNSN